MLPKNKNPEAKPRVFSNDLILLELCLTSAAEHILVFVDHHLDQFVTSRAEILAGIEFLRLFGKGFSDDRGQDQAAIGIYVDLAYGRFGGAAELFGRDPDRCLEFAAILVDHLDVFWND
jgi:hypothetical protein